jgi:hypothetical protein
MARAGSRSAQLSGRREARAGRGRAHPTWRLASSEATNTLPRQSVKESQAAKRVPDRTPIAIQIADLGRRNENGYAILVSPTAATGHAGAGGQSETNRQEVIQISRAPYTSAHSFSRVGNNVSKIGSVGDARGPARAGTLVACGYRAVRSGPHICAAATRVYACPPGPVAAIDGHQRWRIPRKGIRRSSLLLAGVVLPAKSSHAASRPRPGRARAQGRVLPLRSWDVTA